MYPTSSQHESVSQGRESPERSRRKKLRWDLAALIDLEAYQAADENEDRQKLKQRDRAFYLAESFNSAVDRGVVLRRWVESRREENREKKSGQISSSTGELTEEIWRKVRRWGGYGCILLGGLYTWGALNVTGRQVNVTLFWTVTVFLPLLLTVLGTLSLLNRKGRRGSGVIAPLLRDFALKKAQEAARLLRQRVSSEKAQRAEELHGLVRRYLAGHEGVLRVYTIHLGYSLSLGFAMGIVLAIVLFRLVSYQDYGWQTHTGWLTAERMHDIVEDVARPWSWIDGFGDGHGFPNLEQTEATRIYRNQPLLQPQPTASEAWSAFLLGSALGYVFFPRLFLFLIAGIRVRRIVPMEDFSKYDALWRRMTVATVEIASPSPEEEVELPAGQQIRSVTETEPPGISATESILLLPSDNERLPDMEKLRAGLIREHSLDFGASEILPSLPSARRDLITQLAGREIHRIVLVQEVFQVPTDSLLKLLKAFRSEIRGVFLHIVLLGSGEIDENYRTAWNARLRSLGDARLLWHELVIPQENTTANLSGEGEA